MVGVIKYKSLMEAYLLSLLQLYLDVDRVTCIFLYYVYFKQCHFLWLFESRKQHCSGFYEKEATFLVLFVFNFLFVYMW